MDFTVCPNGEPCRRVQQQDAAIAQRLEALMRECRETPRCPTYQDLVVVLGKG